MTRTFLHNVLLGRDQAQGPPSNENLLAFLKMEKLQSANSFFTFRTILAIEIQTRNPELTRLQAKEQSKLASAAWQALRTCEELQWKVLAGDLRVIKKKAREKFGCQEGELLEEHIASARAFILGEIETLIGNWSSPLIEIPALYTHNKCCEFAMEFNVAHNRNCRDSGLVSGPFSFVTSTFSFFYFQAYNVEFYTSQLRRGGYRFGISGL